MVKESPDWPDEPTGDDADVLELAALLRGYLVRSGSPDSRSELARRLVSEGMTLAQLRMLCEYAEGSGRPHAEVASHIGQVLKTRHRWTAYIEDLEYAKAAEAARGGRTKRGKKDRGPVNLPELGAAQRDRQAARAYVLERIRVDGKSREFVAEQTGESLETIDGWLSE